MDEHLDDAGRPGGLGQLQLLDALRLGGSRGAQEQIGGHDHRHVVQTHLVFVAM